MNKKGFTLAEILITLAVIGVVAAITLPSFISDTTTAQIGPKLAKAVSSFEQANEALLETYNTDKLSDTGLLGDFNLYGATLSNHLSIYKDIGYYTATGQRHQSFGPSSADNSFTSKEGFVYMITTGYSPGTTSTPAHKDRAGIVWIDINGFDSPNAFATDVFLFQLMNDGSLQPAGGTFLTNLFGQPVYPNWKLACPKDAVPRQPMFCAGHIFENNLKVHYK